MIRYVVDQIIIRFAVEEKPVVCHHQAHKLVLEKARFHTLNRNRNPNPNFFRMMVCASWNIIYFGADQETAGQRRRPALAQRWHASLE